MTNTFETVRAVLTEYLQLGSRGMNLTVDSRLYGELPEFDSLAVVTVVQALEEHYSFAFDDDDIEVATFETVGSLCSVVDAKRRR